jgi:hypothetical protein
VINYWNATSQQDLESKYSSERVFALIPTEVNCTNPNCGWDEVTQSGKLLGCTICGGLGKTFQWKTFALPCRLVWAGMMQFSYYQPSPGVEMGDCIVTTNQDFKDIVLNVLNTPRAYLVADQKNIRPKTMHESTIGSMTKEYEFVCNTFTPSTD